MDCAQRRRSDYRIGRPSVESDLGRIWNAGQSSYANTLLLSFIISEEKGSVFYDWSTQGDAILIIVEQAQAARKVKVFRASRASLRKYPPAVPCQLLIPLLVTMLTIRQHFCQIPEKVGDDVQICDRINGQNPDGFQTHQPR